MAVQQHIENGQAVVEEKQAGKKERKIGLLPTAMEEKKLEYTGKIVGETTWQRLKVRSLFSVAADGSHPYFKVSKSAFCDLVTGEVTTNVPVTSQQRVYQVKLL